MVIGCSCVYRHPVHQTTYGRTFEHRETLKTVGIAREHQCYSLENLKENVRFSVVRAGFFSLVSYESILEL